jgi:hypothetical protein
MNFTPRTEQELKEINLLPDGKYHYEVIDAMDDVSKKSGNEMIKLILRIYDKQDKAHTVYDYLLSAMEFKLLHFCEANDLQSKYQSGSLTAEDCISKKGIVEIYMQEASGSYGPKNSVRDYIVNADVLVESSVNQTKDEFFSDDVPF